MLITETCIHFRLDQSFYILGTAAQSVTTFTVVHDRHGRFARQQQTTRNDVFDPSQLVNRVPQSISSLRPPVPMAVQPPTPPGHGSSDVNSNALWPTLDNYVQSE